MSPFKVLNLLDTATLTEVKTRWRELAAIHHPDRGGDGETFNILRQAYKQACLKVNEPKTCLSCDGAGKVPRQRGFHVIKLPCTECDGAGIIGGIE